MEKHDFMKKHIDKCSKSGLSIRQYCRENNLPYDGFRHWRMKLTPEAIVSRAPRSSKILPVQLEDESIHSEDIEISLSIRKNNEIVIRIRKPQ